MVIIGVQWGLMTLMEWGLPHFSVYMADNWYSFILPSLLLTLFPTAYLARITSMALGSQEKQLYVLFARTKGIRERMLLWKHMLRNCWSGILDFMPTLITVLLSNLLLVEYLTQFKGAAYRLFQAVGYHNVVEFNGFRIENEVICFLLFVFMFLILLTKIGNSSLYGFCGTLSSNH